MEKFRVVEHFVSINGEGRRAGELSMFIRFAGCNLDCRYCDTRWANKPNVSYESYTVDEMFNLINDSGVKNVTLTGGEPLIQDNMPILLNMLRKNPTLRVEIETNGSIDITLFFAIGESDKNQDDAAFTIDKQDNVTFTIDYKMASSGMEGRMCFSNYQNLRSSDTVKFVVASQMDLIRAKEIIEEYRLIEKGCAIYFSPCFGEIEPLQIVEFLVKHRMNDVKLQLQLHKFIWEPDKRGV